MIVIADAFEALRAQVTVGGAGLGGVFQDRLIESLVMRRTRHACMIL